MTCDVLIVGGGPAGSTAAWKLGLAGADVAVIDAAAFPRDKVCAGWITPRVVADLELDVDDYRRGRTFQVFTGFRVGVIGRDRTVPVRYDRPVGFGVRRLEFDDYLLRRSGARLMLATPVTSIRRDGAGWVVNEQVRSRVLVGAGGHWCPVARYVNGEHPTADRAPLTVAQEAEWEIDAAGAGATAPSGEMPELFFCRDLSGYGWCIRKQQVLNVGIGRLDRRSLPCATSEFLTFLAGRWALPAGSVPRWKGHAYVLHDRRHRCVADEGVLLVGDAAGLADPRSGEGIGPAIASGLLAARTLAAAGLNGPRARLEPYAARLFAGAASGLRADLRSRVNGSPPARALGRALLGLPPFVRHVVLDRWFLHAGTDPRQTAA